MLRLIQFLYRLLGAKQFATVKIVNKNNEEF